MATDTRGHENIGGLASGSTASVIQSLSGIDFPARKDELVKYAQSHNADNAIIDKLRNLPDSNYTNMADVMKGVGEEKRQHR